VGLIYFGRVGVPRIRKTSNHVRELVGVWRTGCGRKCQGPYGVVPDHAAKFLQHSAVDKL
jgi:hypothetical protein